jgi:hypothetical protein
MQHKRPVRRIMQASAGLRGVRVTGKESHGELMHSLIGVDLGPLQEGWRALSSGTYVNSPFAYLKLEACLIGWSTGCGLQFPGPGFLLYTVNHDQRLKLFAVSPCRM